MKKDYQKPTMQVVKLQQQAHILAGSVEATRNGDGAAETDEWD